VTCVSRTVARRSVYRQGMRTAIAIAVMILGAQVAAAQPSMTQPGAPPVCCVPAPYAYQPALSPEDQELLAQGEITDGQHVGGGLVALMFGFGVGQAVQGRWHDTGWIFTVGESASFVAMIYGVIDGIDHCSGDVCGKASQGDVGLIVGGALAFTALHVWEVVDAFVMPPKHNQRVRELKARLGMPSYALKPFVAPTATSGGVAGLSVTF
jgi:hypothetical protein